MTNIYIHSCKIYFVRFFIIILHLVRFYIGMLSNFLLVWSISPFEQHIQYNRSQSTMLIVYYHFYWHYYHTNELFTLAYLLHIYISYRRNQCHKSIWTSSPRILCVGIKFMCKNTLFVLLYLLDNFNSFTESVYLTSRMPIKQI